MSLESVESRMLVDGELVPAASGRTYENMNPATEEVVGEVADAAPDDMERASGAARRAFDETGWATDPELRRRSLRQLQEALAKERGGSVVDQGRLSSGQTSTLLGANGLLAVP